MKQQISPQNFRDIHYFQTTPNQDSTLSLKIIQNNMFIQEQMKKAKNDQQSISVNQLRLKPQTNALNDMFREKRRKKLTKEKMEGDRKFQLLQIGKVREDVSHYYDQAKCSTTSNQISQLGGEKAKPYFHHKQKSQSHLQLLNMDEYKKLSEQLHHEIKALNNEAPNSRVQSIKLKDWFESQKVDDYMPIISVTIVELIKQCKKECYERGLLLEEIWQKIVVMINDLKFKTDIDVQRKEIGAMDEYNRIHFIYKEKIRSYEERLQFQEVQLAQSNDKQREIQNDYKEMEDQFKKNRHQLNEVRRITQFIKKKLEQAHYEIELLNRKLANDKHMEKQSSEKSLKLTQKKIISQDSVMQLPSDSDSEPELLDGLLDDKNIVEMDNMVMNMDKVVTVACAEQQVDDDFRFYLSRQVETQTPISLLPTMYDFLFDSQEKLQIIFEQYRARQKVEETMKLFDEKTKNQTPKLLNQIIEQKFLSQSQVATQFYDQTPKRTQKNIEKQGSRDSREINASFESKQDIERIKTLIIMLQSQEAINKELEQKIEQMKQECDEHLNELNEYKFTSQNNLLLQVPQLDTSNLMIVDDDNKSGIAKSGVYKSRTNINKQKSTRMLFKGPQLGQKVTVTYDFQKINVGPQIVEKIKSKQIPKIKTFMPLKLLLKQISVIYQERIQIQKENPQVREQDMASYVYSYFLQQFGIKKIAEQKFLILVLSVKHHKQIVRINVFAKFLHLFDHYVNYSIDEMRKYLEAYDFVNNISQLGQSLTEQESELRYMVPYLRAVAYISHFADSRMTQEEKEELRKELELIKEIDQKSQNKQAIIDFDQFMIQMFVKYKILVSRAKEYVINAFAACDLDGNGMCNFEEWYLLLRHIEPDRLTPEQISEIFFTNADVIIKSEQNFSFEKFAVVCVEYGLFSEDAQNKFLGIKGNKTEVMIKFTKLIESWPEMRRVIEQRFDQINLLDSEKLDHWREIIVTLQSKIYDLENHLTQTGIEKKVKPLLIANLLLQRESEMLIDMQDDDESKRQSLQSISLKIIQEGDAVMEHE